MSEHTTDPFPESNPSEPCVSEETAPASSAGDEKKSGRKNKSSSEGKSDKEKQPFKAQTVRVHMKFKPTAIATIQSGINTSVKSQSSIIDIVKTAISRLTAPQLITIVNDDIESQSRANKTNKATDRSTADHGESDEE